MKKIIQLVVLFCVCLSNVWAQDTFVVKNIQIEGLQRMTPAAVESYLPIHRGQTMTSAKSGAILRSLYKTGFFDHITLSNSGNTLIIRVTERPTIGQLKVTGNNLIPTDKLTSVMKSMDVSEGRVYNPQVVERITQGLLNQYYMLSRYNARVETSVTPMPRNRVSLKITISEGVSAKIRRISIIGNHAFSDSTLLKQMDISKSGLFSFVTQSDRYSEDKLEASSEKLRNYYLDHGYLRANVKSAQAQITPDRKAVYITFVVEEGQPYTVEGYDLTGKLVVPRSDYDKVVQIKAGDTFSRQKIIDTEKGISKILGEKGYMYATVGVKPDVNDNTHKVFLTFEIKPGKRVYVRHVTFSDNTRTNDVVLRREIEQMEAAPSSTSKLEESKHRLSLLPFIKDTEMTVKPVAGKDDQVDVNYKVKEDNSAQATFKIGYAQLYGVILGAGLNQKNFLGTGNTLGFNIQRSKYEQLYSLDFTDPYYTLDGISRTFTLSVQRVNPKGVSNLSNSYTSNEFDLGVLYGIPVGQEKGVYTKVITGVVYQDTLLSLVNGNVSNQVNAFITQNGRHFQEADFRLGISRDSRDKAIFPTSGSIQTLFGDVFAPVTNNSVSFYTVFYHGKWFFPLRSDQFILTSRADLGYGNGFHGLRYYPFFRNYFAGGFDSVRGYQGYTLGPRDSRGFAYGGNMLVDGSLGLIFPNYLSDSLRTSVFFDVGNVYLSRDNRSYGCTTTTGPKGISTTTCSTNSGPLRTSVGVEADWITPMGPLALSLAKPINIRPGDSQESFQFSLGANF